MNLQEVGGIIAVLAFVLSTLNFWYNFLRRAKPMFVCSRWTVIRMQHVNGTPRAAFAIQVSVTNKGSVPLVVKDLLLVAKTEQGKLIAYEPLLLWDLRQWIEDGNRQDKVGRAQKGQVPLPLLVPPKEFYDFEYQILFLPVDTETMVEPDKHSLIDTRLYALTDRSPKYQLIASQRFGADDLRSLATASFSAVRSTVSIETRSKFIARLKW